MSAPTTRIRAHHVSPARMTARTRHNVRPVVHRQAVRSVVDPAIWTELAKDLRGEFRLGMLWMIGSLVGVVACGWGFLQLLTAPAAFAEANFGWTMLLGVGAVLFLIVAWNVAGGNANLAQELRDLQRMAPEPGDDK